MLLPYRVKNPIRRFPAVTVGIIALNLLVFACTTEALLVVRDSVVERYAFALGLKPFWNLLSSAFLHGDILHIAGNMLFLWIFGPPVEERLGIPVYLALYLIAGLSGSVLQGGMDILLLGTPHPTIGASGCIMGVMGAYWLLFSWSPVCVFYWIYWLWWGTWDIAAFWVIGAYILLDVLGGFVGGGGVANFAHVGGGAAGVIFCLLIRAKRDTGAVSEAKAHADTADLSLTPFMDIQTMLEDEPNNIEYLREFIPRAVRENRNDLISGVLRRAGPRLIEQEPALVTHYLIDLDGDVSIYSAPQLMRAAAQMERVGNTNTAISLYRLVSERYPADRDAEASLYRMAVLYWTVFRNSDAARQCIAEIDARFTKGQVAFYARDLARVISSQLSDR